MKKVFGTSFLVLLVLIGLASFSNAPKQSIVIRTNSSVHMQEQISNYLKRGYSVKATMSFGPTTIYGSSPHSSFITGDVIVVMEK